MIDLFFIIFFYLSYAQTSTIRVGGHALALSQPPVFVCILVICTDHDPECIKINKTYFLHIAIISGLGFQLHILHVISVITFLSVCVCLSVCLFAPCK